MDTHIITPGPYRATKLWNEVTRLFRAGMPVRKHWQNLRHHASCFTAAAAVDWLHQLLQSNSNFGPEVTRQQTVQLLKKFLKNHVIEDVKGRWGTEDLEDNHMLFRFPSTSPLKPIPCPAPVLGSRSIKKRPSLRDREGFFRLRNLKNQEKDSMENVDPALQTPQDESNPSAEEQQHQRRKLTLEDEQEIWRDVTLIHLQRILGVSSLDEVLDQRHVNPQNIIHNMTNVNKHGVVTLEDKSNDLPHWVLSAMKSLANWPKYDSDQPSYPGFERDVFKTVSDYFYSLPQPLLTYELYELFINVLVLCGYVAAPPTLQRGKRKSSELPSVVPAKSSFRSTECLLLSLLRQGSCDEAESPMRAVLSGTLQSRKESGAGGASGTNLKTVKLRTRSCSLETILDCSPLRGLQPFPCSNENPVFPPQDGQLNTTFTTKADSFVHENAAGVVRRSSASSRVRQLDGQALARPHSSCLDIVMETKEEEPGGTKWSSCLNVNQYPPSSSQQLLSLPAKAQGVLQPQCERVAIEALQLCTLLLPPASRRKLQLLMRMASRISQNVDMPRLHPAIGTRTLMVHTFSGCVLSSAEDCDLDELLATRLVSFLMDHQQSVLSVPEYLRSAIRDHIHYLRTVQVPVDSGPSDCADPVCVPMPMYAFCKQISGAEFEQQKAESSQKAMEELLEILLTDQNLTEKDRRKKLKQFQKQYPDIYSRRFPSCGEQSKTDNKPKIKPPLLSIKKPFSIRN
ncbi:PREDICTED: DEP domain-containing protein 1A isoform X2 [Poecilia mexicana]|uniref:DEP domain-containing protein 1A isoform X2 n=1 Tax=Poecilia mexicana TaxID=48701 RepID=UPI00072EA256|nr:PREDICTED: DEP domain-containing protein 1A isoform X2 [Poecilia mexicana]